MKKSIILTVSALLISTLFNNAIAENTVHVMLQEWRILTNKNVIPAGPTRISVQNRGQETHEIVLLKTDVPYNAFPLHPKGGIDEDKAGVVISELEDLRSKTRKDMMVNLKPGNYVLLCNMVEIEDGEQEQHYAMGMRAPLTVK